MERAELNLVSDRHIFSNLRQVRPHFNLETGRVIYVCVTVCVCELR